MRVARGGRPVVDARADDAERAGDERRRPRTGGAVPRHIIHVAMTPRREPVEKARLLVRKLGVGDAHRVETEFVAPAHDRRGERLPIVARVRHGVGARAQGIAHAW